MKREQLIKILPAIPCGLLWWHGPSLLWVMVLPLTWILDSSSSIHTKIKDTGLFLVSMTLACFFAIPLAFYLFIPEKGTTGLMGDWTGLLLAEGIVVFVAFKERQQDYSLWPKKWWKYVLALVSLIILLSVLVPSILSTSEGKRISAKISHWLNTHAKKDSLLIIPGDVPINSKLVAADYQLAPLGVMKLNRSTLNVLTALYNDTYFISPHWKVTGPDPAAHRAVAEWQRIMAASLKEFSIDGGLVQANALYPVKMQKPALDIYLAPKSKTDNFIILRPWQRITLSLLGKRGTFDMAYDKVGEDRILTVTNKAASEKGERICLIGYTAGNSRLNLPVRQGEMVHFVVEARIPDRLINQDNHIFIQDYNGMWDRCVVPFSKGSWTTLIVSKRVRQESSRLILGLRFQPKNREDKLAIKNIYICREKGKG